MRKVFLLAVELSERIDLLQRKSSSLGNRNWEASAGHQSESAEWINPLFLSRPVAAQHCRVDKTKNENSLLTQPKQIRRGLTIIKGNIESRFAPSAYTFNYTELVAIRLTAFLVRSIAVVLGRLCQYFCMSSLTWEFINARRDFVSSFASSNKSVSKTVRRGKIEETLHR